MNSQQLSSWLSSKTKQKPLLMGILNATTDSFYDGGKYTNLNIALDHAYKMISDGADIIDIGGESTRPYAKPIPLDEELNRVIPIIQEIRKNSDICISIDTYKPEVMRAAIEKGATLINDVRALESEKSIITAQKLDVPIILMHMQGLPNCMQDNPRYPAGLIQTITDFFREKINSCVKFGIKRENLILDPGFGFGKTTEHNLTILRNIPILKQFDLPILLGMSRKSTIGAILKNPTTDRLYGSLALASFAIIQGASIIRAHDVAATNQVLSILDAINSRSDVNE